MTITITKTWLAFALLIPATAYATHTFSDVPDGEFYTDAVEWALDNNITTGTSDTTFSPGDSVTRGQNITFAKRYDDNIVQPALSALQAEVDAAEASVEANATDITTNAAGVDTNAADIDTLSTSPGAIVGSIRVQADGSVSVGWMANGNTPTVSHTAATGRYAITWPGENVNINFRGVAH